MDLLDYWAVQPPSHVLHAAHYGYKSKAEVRSESEQDSAVGELIGMFGVIRGKRNG